LWRCRFGRLDRQVPTLSPAERAWLKTEYDNQIEVAGGTYTPRAIAAANSTEYHKRAVRVRLDRILLGLNALSTPNTQPKQAGVRVWIGLAASMMDPSLWNSVEVLVDRKVIDPEINGIKDFYLDNHVMRSHEVLSRVVLPMLDDTEAERRPGRR
jgi:hypothetical protein